MYKFLAAEFISLYKKTLLFNLDRRCNILILNLVLILIS